MNVLVRNELLGWEMERFATPSASSKRGSDITVEQRQDIHPSNTS